LLLIDEKVQALKDEVISIRRHLHRIPEKGLNEHETTGYIYEYLKDLGINAEISPAGTGVIAYIEGKPGSKTIAFRADIDALSIEEQTGAEFCSKNKGFMHACGHDGHAAVLLGFAGLLVNLGNALDNNVLLIFQPAEEGPGGAEIIVKNGVLEQYNASCIFGLHIFPDIEEGKIGCRPGALMAQTGEFDLYIEGKSCHGAMPHKGNDALIAASNVILALNTIVGRFTDPLEPAVVTVGKMVSGERMNVIAGEALLQGTMRAFNDTTYNTLKNRVIKMAESISVAYGCSCRYEIRDMYPAVHNDERLYKILAEDIGGEDFVYMNPLMLAEDFSYYQQRIPGLFFMLGAGNKAKGYIHPLHSNMFNFNDEILITGVQLFYNLLRRCKQFQ
jgi:amidohydrolase